MENLELHVSPADKEQLIIIREDDAKKVYEPRLVPLSGDIKAPGEYFDKRWEPEIQALKDKSHLEVDAEALKITLVVNETDHHAVIVTGSLEFFKDYLQFQINRPKFFTIKDLYKLIRLKRAYFSDRETHAKFLQSLMDFQAKTEIEFKSTEDFKGHSAVSKIQTCKTNLDYVFTLNMPVYRGLPDQIFKVDIEFEAKDGSIQCWLISEDVAELEITLRDKVIDEEVARFSDKIVVIKK